MKSRSLALILVALIVLGAAMGLSGCSKPAEKPEPGQEQPTEETTSTDQPAQGQEDGLYTPAYTPNGNETAVITTSQGKIVVKLFGKDAPIHVGNFVELVNKGFYNGTKFHRYEPGFVIQGGDPQTKDLSPDQVRQALQTGNPPLGTGGPGYNIKAEFDPAVNPNKHERGALGMARSQNPDSAGSQFYFSLVPTPFLDGQYTVFGQITEGLDVMDKLRVGDTIEKIEIQGAE